MAETLTPNPTANQIPQRSAMAAARIFSPSSPFFLRPNDDNLERAAARAARAAAIRRKTDASAPPSVCSSSGLDREQIIELFNNCVKLASENKINQKNSWELKLIDHLSEIIKVEAEDNAETNFQKASCSLEAGVKIYAVRVDAWHADAYKVLSGISRASLEDEQGCKIGNENDTARPMKVERKVSPVSTVESSFEPLTVKKFDVAFAVDPLYRQTSAQFDEGGAKGLLLNNLGVYGQCRVLFDSEEMPGKGTLSANDSTTSSLIDISFASELADLMVMNKVQEISPSLRHIIEQFDQCLDSNFIDNTQQDNDFISSDVAEHMNDQCIDGACDDSEAWFPDHHGKTTVCDEGFDLDDPRTQHYNQEDVSLMSEEPAMEDGLNNFTSPFYVGLRHISMQNAWAGPDHWKYRKPKGPASVSAPDGVGFASKRPKDRKLLELDIDFTSHLDEDLSDMLAPAENPKSLLLPPRQVSYSRMLPEDCHYQPEDLLKLFLLPNMMCIEKPRKRVSGSDSWQEKNYCDGPLPSCDDESEVSGQYDDGFASSDVEQDTLISQPRQVSRIDVQYDRTSKQVDVHILKDTLWNHMQMQGSLLKPETNATYKDGVSFRHILATFPDDCKASANPDHFSPHLCFICLLHLANEHGLTIQGFPDSEDLIVHLPPLFENTGEVIQSSSP